MTEKREARSAKRSRVLDFSLLASLLSLLGYVSFAESLVDIRDIDPSIIVGIRYATADNFVGEVMYPANRCLLRKSVAKRLSKVQENLAKMGLGLKVYDCYRPLSVQRKLWEKVPDENYVANPVKGSRHNRGAAVDLTLVDANGEELEMPSPYDEFGLRAHRSFAGGSPASLDNRALLEGAMAEADFTGLATEWWHFDHKNFGRYPLVNLPLEPVNEIDGAKQIIFVLSKDWEGSRAKVYLMERAGKKWKKIKTFRGVIGKNGLAWGAGLHPSVEEGPQKREGDLKSPAGVFSIGGAYGYDLALPFRTKLTYTPITESLVCVDDPNSRFYNKIVDKSRKDWKFAEEMKREDGLYKRLFVLGHNSPKTVPGWGSCVFFHVWKNKKSATAGCTALAQKDMETILAWLDPGLNPLVIQLPQNLYKEMTGIWNLPRL